MMHIIRKELKSKRASLAIYSGLVVGLVSMYTAMFPTIQQQSAKLSELVNSLGSVYKAFGIQGAISFDTLERFLAVEQYSITWPILAITFVTAFAGQTIAGEIEKGSMGTLLSLPVSRANLFLAKYFAGLIALSVFVCLSVFSTAPIAAIAGVQYHAANFYHLAVIAWLFTWTVFSLGLVLSAIFSEKGRVYMAIGGIMVVMYVANAAASLAPGLNWVKYISLFHYFNAAETLGDNHVSLLSYGVFGCTILICTIAGLSWFTRRDIAV